jgi:hypothetical protein
MSLRVSQSRARLKLAHGAQGAGGGLYLAAGREEAMRVMRYGATTPLSQLVAGVTATAGDLIFTGELSGDLLALDARSGKVLLRSDLGGPARGGVVTYSAHGKQNAAVVSGIVGIYRSNRYVATPVRRLRSRGAWRSDAFEGCLDPATKWGCTGFWQGTYFATFANY